MLTSRPGRIKTIVDIEIDRTVDDVRSGDAFRRHRHDIWSELHSEVERGQAINTAAVVPTITTEKVKHVQH